MILISKTEACILLDLFGNYTNLMDAESRQTILFSNTTAVDFPRGSLIHELFEAEAERRPDAVAIVFEDQELTYRDLNHRSAHLAGSLQQLHVEPEVPVGIYMERSSELIVSILAVLKAGGVCVPLDSSYPNEHLDFVLQDTQPPVVLTQERFVGRFSEKKLNVLTVDRSRELYPCETETTLSPLNMTAENLAFIFYTSGSTGTPKGVMLTHRAIHSHTFWRKAVYNLNCDDRHLLRSSVGFAFLLTEVLTPLLTGGSIIVARPGGHQDTAYLIRLIAHHKISIVNFVPSQIRVMLEEQDVADCASIRHWISGGEALPLWLQQKFHARFAASLSIIYGTTEARSTTIWICQQGEQCALFSIGRPAPNKQIYVLDARLEPVPIREAGELYVAGEGLARGYLNRPELTAEKFVPNPFSTEPGERFYKTGDLAKYLPDGTLEFLGRKDQQVKIRGFRIELGQIEAAIAQHPDVCEAVVIANEDKSGNKQLLAYVVPNQDAVPTRTELRVWLKEKLPEHMIPSRIQVIKALPLTSNGKIDLQALSNVFTETARKSVEPRNQLEQLLVNIWHEVLGIDQIGIHDNFLDLGGNSLKATQIISRIRQRLQIELPFETFFEKATVAELSLVLMDK